MSKPKGFDKINVNVDTDEIQSIIKKYKKIKKYMKSPMYQLLNMNGSETIVSKLLEEKKDPPTD
jgi:hypothetical protein